MPHTVLIARIARALRLYVCAYVYGSVPASNLSEWLFPREFADVCTARVYIFNTSAKISIFLLELV